MNTRKYIIISCRLYFIGLTCDAPKINFLQYSKNSVQCPAKYIFQIIILIYNLFFLLLLFLLLLGPSLTQTPYPTFPRCNVLFLIMKIFNKSFTSISSTFSLQLLIPCDVVSTTVYFSQK